MKVGITLKRGAYTPEAYAYKNFLEDKGFSVQLDFELDPNNDINIFFMGILPFFKKTKGKAIEVHEYQSLSTPPFPHFKNSLKRILNRIPKGRIFLDDFVYNEMGFEDNIPYIKRDMGVDDFFYQKPNLNPDFDIIYSGSISGRKGLIETLVNISKKHKMAVIGSIPKEYWSILKKNNIYMTGKIDRKDLPDLYKNARYGLNYTPNIYPFNAQTSTKTLEYLASGLHLISNKYPWIESFCEKHNYSPIWLDGEEISLMELKSIEIPNMRHFHWNKILDDSNIEFFLQKLVS